MMRHQSSFQFAFPPELADMLKLLHHLRRGSLLNASLLSVDDRCSLRALFLRLPHQECHLMLSPVVFSTRVNTVCPADPPNLLIELEEVPPQTLALWDDVVIAADHFDALFVWSGKSLNNCHTIIDRSNKYDTIRQDSRDFLLQATSHRFPSPTLYNLEEGESMSRRLTSRLAPSHVDPPEQQLAHFERLSLLTSDELHRLRNKFRFCNDTSGDTSFRKWFWDVVSATSKVAKDGQSLTL
uniref:Protein transport protein SEC23 n=1 Tax=Proboscia inermis TaxID=420281 RepID=A0A7S0CA97_9STRA|mmetsp:Transcript_36895/g.37201  ORF Transcript_36895/g.37201 Transcript_36895/m.37201 type:complete len:240 (+) Transcript_36895:418-1137(+)|eukprot:CAMPEP_0171304466 /NCGR_PEP_ID=MMETSP0816-20121228/14191_1 /TAXON_ID=420281 /ORGANISM="Proboscia inermis, Strain CCAP1064/1" /LENGTH=239 /DNA_ID=CAMNT_0011784551 /DNA_START=394 /DNA_END=1113 /DNA_ORIENTATION=+